MLPLVSASRRSNYSNSISSGVLDLSRHVETDQARSDRLSRRCSLNLSIIAN
jgi:hypothetical protein